MAHHAGHPISFVMVWRQAGLAMQFRLRAKKRCTPRISTPSLGADCCCRDVDFDPDIMPSATAMRDPDHHWRTGHARRQVRHLVGRRGFAHASLSDLGHWFSRELAQSHAADLDGLIQIKALVLACSLNRNRTGTTQTRLSSIAGGLHARTGENCS